MKPLVKYRGGKAREIPAIMPHVPYVKGRYVEPFCGGGALYFYLAPRKAIINDINEKLISFYRGVRDDFPSLRLELDGRGFTQKIEQRSISSSNSFQQRG